MLLRFIVNNFHTKIVCILIEIKFNLEINLKKLQHWVSKFMNRMDIFLNLFILSLIFQNFIVFYCVRFVYYSLLFPRYWYFKNCYKKCLYKIYLIFLLMHKRVLYWPFIKCHCESHYFYKSVYMHSHAAFEWWWHVYLWLSIFVTSYLLSRWLWPGPQHSY